MCPEPSDPLGIHSESCHRPACLSLSFALQDQHVSYAQQLSQERDNLAMDREQLQQARGNWA